MIGAIRCGPLRTLERPKRPLNAFSIYGGEKLPAGVVVVVMVTKPLRGGGRSPSDVMTSVRIRVDRRQTEMGPVLPQWLVVPGLGAGAMKGSVRMELLAVRVGVLDQTWMPDRPVQPKRQQHTPQGRPNTLTNFLPSHE